MPVLVDGSQLDAISASLDTITSGAAASDLNDLRLFLTNSAISEIVSVSSWEHCPARLREQMLDETNGWFPVFAANMAHVIKTNEKFRMIYQTLSLRTLNVDQQSLLEKADLSFGFSRFAHAALMEQFDLLGQKLENGAMFQVHEDRILLELSNRNRDLEEVLKSLPFGRRSDGASAATGVEAVIRHLTKFFSGRRDDLNSIDAFVDGRMGGRNNGLLLITAPAGFGKSALAAVWCESNTSDRRYVARHFCNAAGGGTATTNPKSALDYLLVQVAAAYDVPIDLSSSDSALLELIKTAPPDDRQLVIWLDGIDEAQGEFPPFLPEALGERVCLIVSARAPANSTPHYLLPWTTGYVAEKYEAPRYDLERLTKDDLAEFVSDYFGEFDMEVPDGLEAQIYRASDDGYALFSKVMVEDAVKAIQDGRPIDLGAAPLSLGNYAKSQLQRLKQLPRWPDVAPIFNLLTVAREAVDVPFVRYFSSAVNANFEGWDYQLRRWLWVTESTDGRQPPTISFAHPKLAMVFREAIGWEADETLNGLTQKLQAKPAELNRYALRHLPFHMMESGQASKAAELLMDETFVTARFECLGAEIAIDSMASDWRFFRRADQGQPE